jgi:hypothetical protein
LEAQETSDPHLPTAPADTQHPGFIVVDVAYGQDGTVQACRVVRSNAPFALEASTVNYIRKHWKCTVLAGVTAIYPIDFENAAAPKYWNADMAPPPDLFPIGHQTQKMMLRITFGGDGWANAVKVTSPSGDPGVDDQTALWIRVHWHNAAYANRTVDAPFEFVQAPPPPPPPRPQVIKPVPQEPVAIPAIRAE